jgi:hypothetical protein
MTIELLGRSGSKENLFLTATPDYPPLFWMLAALIRFRCLANVGGTTPHRAQSFSIKSVQEYRT